MTNAELLALRDALAGLLQSRVATDEIEEWANAYAFTRRDLIDLLRLLWVNPANELSGTETVRGCEFCQQEFNRPGDQFTCPYCGHVWPGKEVGK